MNKLLYIIAALFSTHLSAQVTLDDILIDDQTEQPQDIRENAQHVLAAIVSESDPRYADIIDKAVQSLGKYATEDAIPVLWERFEKCTHTRGKDLALIAIGRLGDRRQIDKLRTVFESADKPVSMDDLREIQPSVAAGFAILNLKDRSGFVEMNRYLKSRDHQLQRRAARAFALSGDDSSTYLLVEMLSSKDKDVRAAAIDALISVSKPRDEFVIKGLKPMLEDHDEKIRLAAAKGLAILRDDSGAEVLEHELTIDKYQPAILKLLYQLGEKGKALDLVNLLSQDLSDAERQQVADTLVDIHDKATVDPLIKILSGEDKPAIITAAAILGRFAGERAVDPLLELLKNEDEDIQEAAVDSLAEIASPKSLQPLKELKNKLDEGDPRATSKVHFVDKVAVALANIGDSAGLDHFFAPSRLQKENSGPKGIGISSIKNDSVIDRMLKAISDPKLRMRPSTRIDIIDSLAKLEVAQAVPVFISDLKEVRSTQDIPRLTNEEVVRTIEFIGGLGNANNVSELGNWLDDKDPRIRAAAAEAILKLLPLNPKGEADDQQN